MTDPLYLACMAKISILKKEGTIEKFSYERQAYESVDDRSHCQVISQKSTETKLSHKWVEILNGILSEQSIECYQNRW